MKGEGEDEGEGEGEGERVSKGGREGGGRIGLQVTFMKKEESLERTKYQRRGGSGGVGRRGGGVEEGRKEWRQRGGNWREGETGGGLMRGQQRDAVWPRCINFLDIQMEVDGSERREGKTDTKNGE